METVFLVIALTYPTSTREAVLEGGPTSCLRKGRARNEETKDGGQKLGARRFFLITYSFCPLSFCIRVDFIFFSLFNIPHFLFCCAAKDGRRLMESSHVVANTGSLTGDGAEGERQDSTSPLTEHRIHLNTNNQAWAHTHTPMPL